MRIRSVDSNRLVQELRKRPVYLLDCTEYIGELAAVGFGDTGCICPCLLRTR
jgi:hypothetical protein